MMTRVNDPVELGRVVRQRRRELRETQQLIADLCGVHSGVDPLPRTVAGFSG
jgi:hypothetical protein